MLQRWYKAMPGNAVPGIDIARLGVAVIILMHPSHPHGWYVTGPGEHGMEWGFILLVCLFGVLRAYWRPGTEAKPSTGGIRPTS